MRIISQTLLIIMIIFLVLLTAVKFELLTIPENFFGSTTTTDEKDTIDDIEVNTDNSNRIECKITQTNSETLGGTQGNIKSDVTYIGEFDNDILTVMTNSSISKFTEEQKAEITMMKGFMDAMFASEKEKYDGLDYKSTMENNTITFYMKHDLNALDLAGYFGKREDGITTSLNLGDTGPEIKPGSINKTTFTNTLKSEGYTCK